MVQWVNCLLSKQEDLSLDSQHPWRMQLMEACDISAGGCLRGRDRRLLGVLASQLSQNSKFRFTERSHIKNKLKQGGEWRRGYVTYGSTHACSDEHIHTRKLRWTYLHTVKLIFKKSMLAYPFCGKAKNPIWLGLRSLSGKGIQPGAGVGAVSAIDNESIHFSLRLLWTHLGLIQGQACILPPSYSPSPILVNLLWQDLARLPRLDLNWLCSQGRLCSSQPSALASQECANTVSLSYAQAQKKFWLPKFLICLLIRQDLLT